MSGPVIIAIVVAAAIWAAGWYTNHRLANGPSSNRREVRLLVPVIFGVTLLLIWEWLVRQLGVSGVILPPPSAIAARFSIELPKLGADFSQTILKGALPGYLIGAACAFLVAIVTDRSDFMRRGVLPVGSFMAALPIIGIAPIFVKWMGNDWQSKAAVVAVMVLMRLSIHRLRSTLG